jgi:hypothetical protein
VKITIDDWSLGRVSNCGDGREGPRWSARLNHGDHLVGLVSEDGDGGCLRIEAYRSEDRQALTAAAVRWVKTVAGKGLKCVATEDAFIHRLAGMSEQDVLDAFFAADVPPPTRPSTPQHLDNAIQRMLHTLRRGHALMASVSTYGKASTLGREEILTTLAAWHAEGCLDPADWRGLWDFPVTGEVWAAEVITADVAAGVEPIPDSVVILLPQIDSTTHQPLPPRRMAFIRRQPSFGEACASH